MSLQMFTLHIEALNLTFLKENFSHISIEFETDTVGFNIASSAYAKVSQEYLI